MCGVVLAFTPGRPTRADTVEAMARTLRHRGPDDEGFLGLDGMQPFVLGGADTPQAVMAQPTPWQPQGRAAKEQGRRW